jgi:invasion protein IalB
MLIGAAVLGLPLAGFGALAQPQPPQRPGQPQPAAPTPAPSAPTPAAPAQVTPAQVTPAPVASTPNATTAAFGDWVMRCARQGEAVDAPRVCEAALTLQVQGQQGPVLQFAFGRLQSGQPLRITVVTPPNVAFPSTVALRLQERGPALLDLNWRRCIPGACIAEADPTPALMQQLRSLAEPARVVFKDAADREVILPLSVRGLPQALDALQREMP